MPNYVTSTGVAMGVGGPMHKPTFYRDAGVSLHPFQRVGLVPANAHRMGGGVMRAAGLPGSDIGQGRFAASTVNIPWPPIVPTPNASAKGFQIA